MRLNNELQARAIAAALAVDELVLVPKEPTKKVIAAYIDADRVEDGSQRLPNETTEQ